MPLSTTCKKCGVQIQGTTAETTGGFCMPCRRNFLRRMPVVESIRSYCLKKKGVTRSPDDNDDFWVLTESGFFARLDFKTDPPILLVRCNDALRPQLQSQTDAVRESKRISWPDDMNGWNWTDIAINGSLDEATLLETIDDAYQITYESLSNGEKACLSLLSRNLAPSSLLNELLTAYGLQRRKEQIIGTGKQAFLLRTEPSKAGSSEVGQSRLGGLPDLDESVPWPAYSNGKPLAFLAQFNLSDLPTVSSLPKSGLLSFFSVFGWQDRHEFDPHVPGGKYKNDWTKVIYNPSIKTLRRANPPGEVNVFKSARASFVPLPAFPGTPKN